MLLILENHGLAQCACGLWRTYKIKWLDNTLTDFLRHVPASGDLSFVCPHIPARISYPTFPCVERLHIRLAMYTRLIRSRRSDRHYKDVSLIQILLNGGILRWFASLRDRILCSYRMASCPTLLGTDESKATPTSFILPDLVAHCPFPLVYHPNGDTVAQESVDWLDTSCPDLSVKQRKALRGLKAGELTAYCYHTTQPERLRVISDFMNYLFHLDNISDGMMTRDTEVLSDSVMNALWFSQSYRPTNGRGKKQPLDELNAGKLARDFWARCIPGAGPGTQARFKETLAMFFESVHIQAQQRDSACVADLESYISLRRDTSGCKPCWALIEYALDIDLPPFVVEDPVIMALNQSTNDLVTWSNDIFSYNVEQSRGDTHNMITILMKYHGHTLQTAVDYVGELCRSTINTFIQDRASVPSWGPDIDKMVAQYVDGLEAWIVGSLHWSFMTERYFGKAGADVKKNRFVALLPS